MKANGDTVARSKGQQLREVRGSGGTGLRGEGVGWKGPCEFRLGPSARAPAQHPPPTAVLEKTWVLRSEVVGTGGRRQKGEGSTPVRSLRLPLSRSACAMAPGCGPMVLISFLPLRDNNSHC